MNDLSTATRLAPYSSAVFDADLDVVAYTGLKTGVDTMAAPSMFGDDIWDLSAITGIPAYARRPSLLRIDWGRVANPRWRLCVKELGLALLQPAVGLDHRLAAARRSPLPPHDLAIHLQRWQTWFAWLARHNITRLADVTQAHCDAWLAGRRVEVDPATVRAEVIDLRYFADYRPILTADSYPNGFRPWAGKSASKVAGWKATGENRTAVIPDEVYGPLLASALFLVQVAGPDVVAARNEWRRLQSRPSRVAGIDDRMARHLAGLRRTGTPLPELHPIHLDHQRGKGTLDETDPLHRVNLRLIEWRIGAYSGATTKTAQRRATMERAVTDLGCSGGGLNTPVTAVANPADPDQRRPWHPAFSPYDLEDLGQMVHTACYVVIAALSGMRRSELAEMRRGCVRAEQLANGKLRFRVHAKLIKGKRFGGQDERWTVIEQVAQAFSLVESLTDADHPFAHFQPSARYPKLIRWTNGPGAQAFLAPIPSWQFSGRQFRRTLARLLGFRPHGVIAGKIHLKHISVVTSEGYYGRAGSSAAAFLAEIENETAHARVETTTRLYHDWIAGAPIGGPGRIELAKLFSDVQVEMHRFEGSVVDSDRRLEELLRRRAATLHVGPLNNCWFVDPARAHCLKTAGRPDATTPLIGMCEPTRCANATNHPEHVPVWIDTDRHLNALIASGRVPKHEKERLTIEKTRVHAVVKAATTDTAPK